MPTTTGHYSQNRILVSVPLGISFRRAYATVAQLLTKGASDAAAKRYVLHVIPLNIGCSIRRTINALARVGILHLQTNAQLVQV